ncbi:hypothetical protein IW140_000907 [Coemansia sp. RSA 1813]|nr:hypothetical protein EV178_001374 [Coemansia sp. RSA 1646]KAJ1770624.1 hypothetical protein LPJ74_002999 [Coemansia sp. RSA 1843]KAJ2093448.1 hypothetical protein IW138_000298 [Coemansia sp. RSA 986]KAJ2217256.1 hypothetical protein EV179_000723 [Coemansia sp. RSA 487]KAJ2572456.1 hypothetical protein IW140_000907 [Coemansia sp. RSA 1813]
MDHHVVMPDGAATDTQPLRHPYYPLTLDLPGYTKPTHSTTALVSTMGASIGVLLAATFYAYTAKRRRIELSQRLTALWFVMCGALHSLFELYYLVQYRTLAQEQSIVADMWKEYALSDSRYLSAVPMVRTLETITVLVTAPLCWTVAYAIWTDMHAIRHLAQLSASLLHLYSVVIYYGTEFMSPASNCRPEHIYYYGYFVAMNIPWLLVPVLLGVSSFCEIYRCMAMLRASRAP